jgi:hypothetical protein
VWQVSYNGENRPVGILLNGEIVEYLWEHE